MSDLIVGREQIMAELDSVPMLSPSAARVLDISNDPDCGVMEVARVVETDSVLTSHILNVVNSAAFSLTQKADTLDRAVSYLGRNVIVGIAVSHSLSAMYNKPLKGYEGQKGDLWAHSLRTALASRELARFAGKGLSSNLAYTAGLLHDIGKSVISKFLEGSTGEMIAGIENGEVADFLAAERNHLGTDHCEVGAELAKVWGLPESLQEAIFHHHRPRSAKRDYRPLVYTVHLGDMLSMMSGLGTGPDSMTYQLAPEYAEYVKISEDELTEMWFAVEQEFSKTKTIVFGDEEGDEL